jgi:hypothetical protein
MQKTLFTFWDSENIPQPLIDNLKKIKSDFDIKIKILNDKSINEFEIEFPILFKLFNSCTIASYKSDIIRFLYLYRYGGLWFDTSVCFKTCNLVNLYEQALEKFDICPIIIPSRAHVDNIISPGIVISKPNNKFLYETLKILQKRGLDHYIKESESGNEIIKYNIYLLIPPKIWLTILNFNNNMILADNNLLSQDCFQPQIDSFKEFNVGLLNWTPKYVQFYCCNMDHHHGKNFHLHWSTLQKKQKLFNI